MRLPRRNSKSTKAKLSNGEEVKRTRPSPAFRSPSSPPAAYPERVRIPKKGVCPVLYTLTIWPDIPGRTRPLGEAGWNRGRYAFRQSWPCLAECCVVSSDYPAYDLRAIENSPAEISHLGFRPAHFLGDPMARFELTDEPQRPVRESRS
jgi:hypothetical protein